MTQCALCQCQVAEDSLTEREICETCSELSIESLPEQIAALFPDSVDVESNPTNFNQKFVIVKKKSLLRANEIVVIDRNKAEVVNRRGVGFIARVAGVFR
jgi:hypothetical protein